MSRKTIVAVYDDHSEAQEAVRALHDDGFTSDQISLVASDRRNADLIEGSYPDSGTKASAGVLTGGFLGGIAGLVAGLVGMTIPGLGPIVAAGPIATGIGGALAGALAGGILGGLIGLGIPESEAHLYAEGLRRGNTLLGVTVPEERLDLATTILDRFNPIDIDERANSWRQEGWERFDETATPYTRPVEALEPTTATRATSPSSALQPDPTLARARARSYAMLEPTAPAGSNPL